MPLSMTGFGRAAREGPLWQVTVEVKAVNHRFLKLHLRLPPLLESLETEVENRVRARVGRGALNLSTDLRLRDTQLPPQLEAKTARGHVERLTTLWAAIFPDAAMPEPARMFEMLLRMPGPPPESAPKASPELAQAFLAAVEEAVDALQASRKSEGEETGRALAQHRDHVANLRERIAAKAPLAIKAAQTRFVERINQILGEARPGLALDSEALLRESALYADRGDITEELARLQGHIGRFDEVLGASSEAGRRLEFLLQEMLREANTIGSKSLDLAISHDVVELKAEIEKMKEQVQNLE